MTWINLINANPSEIEAIRELFPFIHPLNLEDLSSEMERPKIDEDDEYLYVVMHFPSFDAKEAFSRAKEVDFVVGRGYIITSHDGTLKPLVRLFDACEADEGMCARILGRGANHMFYTIIDQLVDYIEPILRKVDVKIRLLEENIFSTDTRSVMQQLSLARRDIIALRRIIRQQVPIVEQLERGEHPILHEDLEEYFGDIADHLYRERDMIDENYEIINSLADTVNTLATYRVNEVIRILTVISVIILPLTLFSSIYGMNIPLPLTPEHAANPKPFFVLATIMLGIAVGTLLYFRRRGWI